MVCLIGHIPLCFHQLDPGAGTKPIRVSILTHLVNAKVMSHGIEKVVAGIAKREGHIFLAMSIMLSFDTVPDPAFRGVTFSRILGKNAFALDFIFSVNLTFSKNRCCHTGFKRRTRSICAH